MSDDACQELKELIILARHVLTGSYHNYFRIYDTDTLNDVVLQADKSAFKAKKIGGPLPKAAAKNGSRLGNGLRDAMSLETLDFNKKILHASWHPRENTIAVSRCYAAPVLVHDSCRRLLQRTICSCTAPHEFMMTLTIILSSFPRPRLEHQSHSTPHMDNQQEHCELSNFFFPPALILYNTIYILSSDFLTLQFFSNYSHSFPCYMSAVTHSPTPLASLDDHTPHASPASVDSCCWAEETFAYRPQRNFHRTGHVEKKSHNEANKWVLSFNRVFYGGF